MEKGRITAVLLCVVAAVGLLAYGLLYNSTPVVSPSPAEVPVVQGEPNQVPVAAQPEVLSEPAVTQEVARGGVTRDAESGAIKKTYTGKEAPKACPT